ncbi:MAG: F0F1 ATP synthase subunit delta [Chloroflexi bacterium]|nr:F0F1 ATP synthase subunit delta [Chloroflexota bacterium]
MQNERPSKIYAQAAFDQAVESWLTPLKAIAAAMDQSAAFGQLDDASLPFSKKQEILQGLIPAQASGESRNFLLMLASKNEMHLLPEIVDEYERFAQRRASVTFARVTSAVPLTDGEKQALEAKLKKGSARELEFDYSVDPAILGGIVVRTGDKVVDGSVAGKLASLKEKLK